MEYFRVRNWEQFQHYKKRNPPWIKLYTHLLDDYEYGSLTDASKLLALSILMLAAKTGNKLPMNIEWIQKRAVLVQAPDLEPLFSCGFIYKMDASEVLASRKQNALSEERRGEESIQKGQKAASRKTELKAYLSSALKAVPK